MRILLMIAAMLAVGFSGAVQAENTAEPTTTDLNVIADQQKELRALVLEKTGRFGRMPDAERDELLQRQGELLALIEGKDNLDQLPQDEQIVAFNNLEWIKGAINNEYDADIVVCKQRRRTGSHLRRVECLTQAQIKQNRAQVDRVIRAMQAGPPCKPMQCK